MDSSILTDQLSLRFIARVSPSAIAAFCRDATAPETLNDILIFSISMKMGYVQR